MSEALPYIISSLRRGARENLDWTLYPAESGAIVEELDRLRAENEELRKERPAVVAWLRENIWQTDDRENFNHAHAADTIERGEHRREEER